jgi:hypothetical protein
MQRIKSLSTSIGWRTASTYRLGLLSVKMTSEYDESYYFPIIACYKLLTGQRCCCNMYHTVVEVGNDVLDPGSKENDRVLAAVR